MTPPPADLPPRLALELADAELAGLQHRPDGSLCLRLSAAPAAGPPPPGQRQAEAGHALGVLLCLTGATVLLHSGTLLGRIAQADCRVQGQLQRRLPLPGQLAGPVRLHLHGAHGAELQVQADALRLAFEGPPRWQAALAC